MNWNRVSRPFALMAALFVAGLTLHGCGKRLTESDVPYAATLVDCLLAGIAERDYGKFSLHFSPAMKEALGEEAFLGLIAELEGKLGEYRGRTFLHAVRANAATGGKVDVITYRAEYS